MNRKQILASVQDEHNILKHLFSKLSPEDLSYSPGEKMRTADELLRYISMCATSSVDWYDIQVRDRDKENAFEKYNERVTSMDIKDFPKMLDLQYEEIEGILNSYTDEDLLNKKVSRIAGPECPLGEAIVNSSLKYLTAYRMQFFLYLKQNGKAGLNTWNVWGGIDPPPKEA